MRYIYTAWLRDDSLPEDDPEFEWPACFLISGRSAESARQWGDHLAKRYSVSHGLVVSRSGVVAETDSALPGVAGLPVVEEGSDATDDEIGW